MANQQTNKSDIAENVPGRESQSHGLDAAGAGDALDVLRTSVAGVLDSVVREYEPQIAEFTTNFAHQAVDRGVEIAQGAVAKAKSQSWLRLGVAAVLGVGIIAVLTYEAEQAAAPSRARKH